MFAKEKNATLLKFKPVLSINCFYNAKIKVAWTEIRIFVSENIEILLFLLYLHVKLLSCTLSYYVFLLLLLSCKFFT